MSHILETTFKWMDVHDEFTDNCKLFHHYFYQTYSQNCLPLLWVSLCSSLCFALGWLQITAASSGAREWPVHRCSVVCLESCRGRGYTGLSHSSGCSPLAALVAGSVWMWRNHWSGQYLEPLEGQEGRVGVRVKLSVREEWQAGVWLSKKKA